MSRTLDVHVAQALGWRRIEWEGGTTPMGRRPENILSLVLDVVPHYSTDIAAAWMLVERLRDMWTAATSGSSGMGDDFAHPFDDLAFFEHLHRSADRRWPWAFLYVTPEAICEAFLSAVEGRGPSG